MTASTLSPMRVPTLTEVVEWPPKATAEAPRPRPDADHLPVLSEEAVLPQDGPQAAVAAAEVAEPERAEVEAAVTEPEPQAGAPSPAPIDEATLTQRIVGDLQRQVDLMLEHRLQAALTPLLERLTQTLARDARDELALTLRDLVAEAVSHELARHRHSPDRVEPD